MILGGRINDRFGPRAFIPAGGLVMGIGFCLAARAATPLELILGYGLGFGPGLGFVYGSSVNTTLKLFPDHRGLAGVIATAAYGLSSVTLPPVAHALIETEGIEAALLTLGGVFMVVIAAGGLLLEKCPDGFAKQFTAAAPSKRTAAEECGWRGMLRSKRFPPMAALMLCGAIPGMMTISHCWSLAKDVAELEVGAASAMVSMLALANVFGMLLAGPMAMNVFKEAGMSYQAICLLAGTLALLGLVFAYLFDRAKKGSLTIETGTFRPGVFAKFQRQSIRNEALRIESARSRFINSTGFAGEGIGMLVPWRS